MKIDWQKFHGRSFAGVPALVTGGAGFIGSHLADALVELGANVRIYDDFTSGQDVNVNPRAILIRASILDRDSLAKAMAGVSLVFHQAALVSVPASLSEPLRYNEVNVDGTACVLDAARLAGAKRVMFAASSSAYGDTDELPKHEKMPPLSKSPYAANKVAGEHLVRAYANSFDLDAVSLRYFNIFGPRQRADSPYSGVIAKFAAMLLAGKNPPITGDGTATRDFTFVANAVHANLLAARHASRLDGDVLNVATQRSVSITELAVTMARLLGRPDLTPAYLAPRPGDVRDSLGDLSKIRTALGYEVIAPFEEGLRSTLEWYKTILPA